MFVLTMLGSVAALSACSAGPGKAGGPFFAPPEQAIAMGDWNDVDASVEAGARAAEMAVVTRRLSDDERTRTYELVTVHDDPARLTATLRAGADGMRGGGAAPIGLSASVGRWGDTTQERKLLRAVRIRIEKLSGVESAPLPEDIRDLLK